MIKLKNYVEDTQNKFDINFDIKIYIVVYNE